MPPLCPRNEYVDQMHRCVHVCEVEGSHLYGLIHVLVDLLPVVRAKKVIDAACDLGHVRIVLHRLVRYFSVSVPAIREVGDRYGM